MSFDFLLENDHATAVTQARIFVGRGGGGAYFALVLVGT